MGYYDFNDHFWAPHEVCKQKIVPQYQQFSFIEKLHKWFKSFRYSTKEILETASEKELILSTSQVASALELNSETLINHQSFERYGFIVSRSEKVAGEVGWKVVKVD